MQGDDDDDNIDVLARPAPVMIIPANTVRPGRLVHRDPTRRQRNTGPDPEELEEIDRERQNYIVSDIVVQAISSPDSKLILNSVKIELAREVASLGFLRQRLEKECKDTRQVSVSRSDILKKISDIELEARKIGVDQIDVHGEKMQRIFKFWIELLEQAAIKTLTTEQADLLFVQLTTVMEGWEDKAAELVR